MIQETSAASAAQRAYDQLRRHILDMEIGPGERLTERWVEEQVGASRTSVRTALMRLEAEGLVARQGRGWIVPPIEVEEVEQLFVYREVLERAAIRLSTLPISDEDFARIDAVMDSMTPDSSADEVDAAGRLFHQWVASLGGNEFIRRGIADAMTRLQRVRWLEADASHAGWDEHRAIVAALRAGDPDRAADLMAAHTRETRIRLIDTVRKGRRSMRARGATVREA